MIPSGYNRDVLAARMPVQFILSQYLDEAMASAAYDKLEDGSFGGRIPACTGVLAFRATLRECERELRSTLEDWGLVGLKLEARERERLSQEAYDQIFGPFDRGEFRELTDPEWQALMDGQRKSPHDSQCLALPPKG